MLTVMLREGSTVVIVDGGDAMARFSVKYRRKVMTHKYRGCIVVLSINESVKPNEDQKVLTSIFYRGFTVNTSKQVCKDIYE
jgi:hypothetical protein